MASTRQILLVDDDRVIRELARAGLELVGGYQVVTASSGQECLELSRRNAPDVILLDVMMPGLSGPVTYARLQEQPETTHVPVVLLTAKTQEADRRQLFELGVAGVLSKPFNPLTLPGEIADVLGWER